MLLDLAYEVMALTALGYGDTRTPRAKKARMVTRYLIDQRVGYLGYF
jgi:hypothetical protein